MNIRMTTLSISLLLSRLVVLFPPDLFLWSGLGFDLIWSGLGPRQRSHWCYRRGEEGFQPGRLQEYERHVRDTDVGHYTIKWKKSNNQIIPDESIKQLNNDIILFWWLNHQIMSWMVLKDVIAKILRTWWTKLFWYPTKALIIAKIFLYCRYKRNKLVFNADRSRPHWVGPIDQQRKEPDTGCPKKITFLEFLEIKSTWYFETSLDQLGHLFGQPCNT